MTELGIWDYYMPGDPLPQPTLPSPSDLRLGVGPAVSSSKSGVDTLTPTALGARAAEGGIRVLAQDAQCPKTRGVCGCRDRPAPREDFMGLPGTPKTLSWLRP